MWSVKDPVVLPDTAGLGIGKVVKYMVTGSDSEGDFQIQRRYNEFMALKVALNLGWPGCYVPAIPEKQFLGDKEDGFIEERRLLLERFVRECAKYEYLTESKEFKIFSRQQGEVANVLEKMPKMSPT